MSVVSWQEAQRVAGFGTVRWWPATNRVVWSENLFRLFGLDPRRATASTEWWLEHVHPADFDHLALRMKLLAQGERAAPFDYRMVREGGQVIHVRTAIADLEQHAVGARYISGLLVDVSERADDRRETHEAVAAARAQWGTFDAIAEGLLGRLANSLGFDLGVLWRPVGDVLVPCAVWRHPRIDEDVASEIRSLRPRRGMGLAGRAWLSREALDVANIADDPRFKPSQPLSQARFRRAVAVPVLVAGEVLAVLGLFARGPGGLTDETVSALAILGSLIGTFLSYRKDPAGALPALTQREHEVLQLAAYGQTISEIAQRLNVSRSTIKTHLDNTYRKLGVSDRTAAVAELMRQGLIH